MRWGLKGEVTCSGEKRCQCALSAPRMGIRSSELQYRIHGEAKNAVLVSFALGAKFGRIRLKFSQVARFERVRVLNAS